MNRYTLTARLSRLVAGVLSGLVAILGLLAVSPEAHSWLHAHDYAHQAQHDETHGGGCKSTHTPEAEEGCVVELFAQGIETGASAIEWVICLSAWAEPVLLPHEALKLSSPRYLWQPEAWAAGGGVVVFEAAADFSMG